MIGDDIMENSSKNNSLKTPIILFVVFIAYTFAVTLIDVQSIGPLNSSVGMATINGAISKLIGTHMIWYDITQILGILALLIVAFFAFVGVLQLVTRKSILRIDRDIIILGCFYVVVLACYVLFNKFAINYRPVILEGELESSYPSSHTMLAICVMSTAIMQVKWKLRDEYVSKVVQGVLTVLIVLTVVGRLISGVHWFTDIVGGVLLSALLVSLYTWFVREVGGPGTNRNKRRNENSQARLKQPARQETKRTAAHKPRKDNTPKSKKANIKKQEVKQTRRVRAEEPQTERTFDKFDYPVDPMIKHNRSFDYDDK